MDLQESNGDINMLYKDIGDAAVAKAAPELMLEGGIIGSVLTVLLGVISILGYKGTRFIKARNEKIRKEPALKEEFIEIVKTESLKIDTKEQPDSDI